IRTSWRLPVSDHSPVFGLYSSAEWRDPWRFVPPATSTLPSCSKVAVWNCRASCMLPVRGHAPGTAGYARETLSGATAKQRSSKVRGEQRLIMVLMVVLQVLIILL